MAATTTIPQTEAEWNEFAQQFIDGTADVYMLGALGFQVSGKEQQAREIVKRFATVPEARRAVSRLERFADLERSRTAAGDYLDLFRRFRDGGRLDLFERLLEAKATGQRDAALSEELSAFHNA